MSDATPEAGGGVSCAVGDAGGVVGGSADSGAGGGGGRGRRPAARRRSFGERVEAFVSKLSTRNNFWHRVCSMIWLPYAFKSGIKMKRVDAKTFTAVLPFRRFNRNWYNAMAGASLLANSEIAGGMYVFTAAGEDYTVVCKELTYRFLRPCFGPAVYRITPQADLEALVASGAEFNIEIQLDIYQGLTLPGKGKKDAPPPAATPPTALPAPGPGAEDTATKSREKRVGRCFATFHVTPKALHVERKKLGRKPMVQ